MTDFNPNSKYLDVTASQLKATFEVKFNTNTMYKDFKKKYKNKWECRDNRRTAKFTFQQEAHIKRLVVLLVLCVGTLLCSCAREGENMTKNNDQAIVNRHFDRVLMSIQNENKNALLASFSQDCHPETNIPGETIEKLFEYFDVR